MATDVKINSLDLLRQYQAHFRNFADCVEAGIVLYRDKLKSRKDDAERMKREDENRAASTLEKIDYRVNRVDEIQ